MAAAAALATATALNRVAQIPRPEFDPEKGHNVQTFLSNVAHVADSSGLPAGDWGGFMASCLAESARVQLGMTGLPNDQRQHQIDAANAAIGSARFTELPFQRQCEVLREYFWSHAEKTAHKQEVHSRVFDPAVETAKQFIHRYVTDYKLGSPAAAFVDIADSLTKAFPEKMRASLTVLGAHTLQNLSQYISAATNVEASLRMQVD
ncbi:unnamed protein product, partial [Phaeothamnion confervicola]